MKAYVVYESMYGNTHLVAEAIAAGLRATGEVIVGSVGEIPAESVTDADLLVVGGPTHMHGMSRQSTRKLAAEAAAADEEIDLEPDAAGLGVREWFKGLPKSTESTSAAFDTRANKPAILVGSAAKGIAKMLRGHRFEKLADPMSFFIIDSPGPLETGEAERAEQWGAELGEKCLARASRGAPI